MLISFNCAVSDWNMKLNIDGQKLNILAKINEWKIN